MWQSFCNELSLFRTISLDGVTVGLSGKIVNRKKRNSIVIMNSSIWRTYKRNLRVLLKAYGRWNIVQNRFSSYGVYFFIVNIYLIFGQSHTRSPSLKVNITDLVLVTTDKHTLIHKNITDTRSINMFMHTNGLGQESNPPSGTNWATWSVIFVTLSQGHMLCVHNTYNILYLTCTRI